MNRYPYRRRISATEFLGNLVIVLGGFALLCGLSFLVDVLGAQFVVWGLALEHVHSGIWGPFLILAGFSLVIGTSAAVNGRKK